MQYLSFQFLEFNYALFIKQKTKTQKQTNKKKEAFAEMTQEKLYLNVFEKSFSRFSAYDISKC